MIRTFALLLVFQSAGEILAFALRLPVPGPVIGLAMLLGWLLMEPARLEPLREDTRALLRHLSLLFVPAGVGVMLHAGRLADEGAAIAAALVGSAVLSICATALAVAGTQRWLARRAAREAAPGDDSAAPGAR